MVHSLGTALSLLILTASVSCTLNQEIFTTFEDRQSSAILPDEVTYNLKGGEIYETPQIADTATQDATWTQRQLISPAISMTSDVVTTDIHETADLTGYLFQLFYDDPVCAGPAVSGFSVKLNICSPNEDIYFFVTTTLTETTTTYYLDSKCTILKEVRTTPYFASCMGGTLNIIESTFVLPTKVKHVAIRSVTDMDER